LPGADQMRRKQSGQVLGAHFVALLVLGHGMQHFDDVLQEFAMFFGQKQEQQLHRVEQVTLSLGGGCHLTIERLAERGYLEVGWIVGVCK